jgi:hypothetical protein
MGAITYLKYWEHGQLHEVAGKDISELTASVRHLERHGLATIVCYIEHPPVSL